MRRRPTERAVDKLKRAVNRIHCSLFTVAVATAVRESDTEYKYKYLVFFTSALSLLPSASLFVDLKSSSFSFIIFSLLIVLFLSLLIK